MWKEKPKTMIRKVAIVQTFREAFPDELGGLYSEEEMPEFDHNKYPNMVEIQAQPTLEELAQQIANIQTVKELEQWYKDNKKNVTKEVVELLKARKEAINENL